mgnify:FL=1
MKYSAFTLVFILIASAAFFAFQSKKSQATEIAFYQISINDVSNVYSQLESKGQDSSYSTFVFFPSDPNEESHVEIQFSIEGGTIGFDWILLGEIKTRDMGRFIQLANKYGYNFTEITDNNVKYLRVEGGDLINLCKKVMMEMYGIEPSSFMELIAARFEVVGLPLLIR